MKKKSVGIIAIIVSILATVSIIILTISHVQKSDAITRYEWIKLLCDRENIEGYENTPFYADVDETNEYYDYIQSAVERDIIPIMETFEGDKVSTGRFVALTAMRSVGPARIKISQAIDGKISDEDYLDIAVKYDLIAKNALNRSMSANDCQQLLDKLDELYYTAFLKDDYEYIEYKDEVVVIPDDDVYDYAPDYSAFIVGSNYNNLKEGDVVIFTDKNTHAAVARKIVGDGEDGEYRLAVPEIDEVIEELEVSDIVDVTAEDIFNYYGYRDTVGVVNTSFFNTPHVYESEGFTIKVETDSHTGKNNLLISVINNETGVKFEIPNNVMLEDYEKYAGEFSIKRMTLASMISYNGKLDYVDMAMDIDMHGEMGIESEVEKRIPLFKMSKSLDKLGVINIIVKVNLLIDIDGTIRLVADMPVTYDIGYDSTVGTINKQSSFSVENGEFKIDCNGELSGEIEGIANMLFVDNIMDAEIRAGATADAKYVERPNGMICRDIEAKAPVVVFALCDDNEAESLLSTVLDTDRFKIQLDSVAKRFHFHHETFTNGSEKFVDECTYKEPEHKTAEERVKEHTEEDADTVDGEINTVSTDGWFTYTTKYGIINHVDSNTFEFEYPNNWMITEEQYDQYGPAYGIIEQVVLEDVNGARITYMHYTGLGAGGSYAICGETTKVADSKFVPSYPNGTDTDMSSLGAFAVAQVHITKSMDGYTDEDYKNVDDNPEYATYGIIPENRLGSFEDIVGTDGLYEMLSFEYPIAKYCFIAEPPAGGWTKEEREEMIGILSSFRIAN